MGLEVLAEGAEQGVHLGVIEAEQTIKLGIKADISPDVEAAGDIVHGQRRHAGDEQPASPPPVPPAASFNMAKKLRKKPPPWVSSW